MDSNNLITREDLVKRAETPLNLGKNEPGLYRAAALDVASVITAALFGFAYARYIAGSFSPWITIIAILLFGSASGIQALVNDKKGRRTLILGLEVIMMSIFFYRSGIAFIIIAALLSFIFLAWGYFDTQRELYYTTEIRFFSVTRDVLGKFVTAILLFMIILYVPRQNPQSLFISQNSFESLFNWSAGVAQDFYPKIQFRGSLNEFAEGVAASQLENNSGFATLPSSTQSMTIAQGANQLINNFSNGLGIPINASDTIGDVLYRFIIKTLQGWQQRYSATFLIGWTIVVFLILRSIGVIFTFINQLVLAGIYEILIASGFMKIKEEPATKETIFYP